MKNELTREELFLLVWERPSQEIAKELGISDVALGKRCKKLQIPKPPPGYWAKFKAGKRPKKPVLKEFSEQLFERQKARARQSKVKRGWIGLSPLQAEIFQQAANELAAAGINLVEMEITKSGARLVDGELATQILLLIQKRYLKWLKNRSNSDQVAHASIRSVQALVSKLLPLAKAHVLLLEKKPEKHHRDDHDPKVVIRITHEFIQRVANLRRVVTENNLSHVVWDLAPLEHAWIVQYQYNSDRYIKARSQLCISKDYLWVVCGLKSYWNEEIEDVIETSKIPLADIAPIELVLKEDVVLPTVLDLTKLRISRKRLKAFLEVDHAYDILSGAVYKHDYPVPDDYLVLLERIFLGKDAGGPLSAARQTCEQMADDMEKWELAMEAERESICAEALGLTIGDTILTESRGKSIRLKIDQMGAYAYDGKLAFHISGKRYRQDGLLGKRDETVYLSTEIEF